MRRGLDRREDLDLVSPDGQLRFRVRWHGDDATLGFEGGWWHTHPDMLGAAPGEEAAVVARFLEDLLAGRLLIAVIAFKGGARDVKVTGDPGAERRLCEPGESVAFRLWDGTAVEV